MRANTTPDTKRQLPRFLVTGCSAVAVDSLVYLWLLPLLGPAPSKAVSFLSGTVVAFFLNKYWTFEKNSAPMEDVARFAVLYTATFGVNVGVNQGALLLLPGALVFGFLAATGTSTVLNFLGQKYWVFRHD